MSGDQGTPSAIHAGMGTFRHYRQAAAVIGVPVGRMV